MVSTFTKGHNYDIVVDTGTERNSFLPLNTCFILIILHLLAITPHGPWTYNVHSFVPECPRPYFQRHVPLA